MVKIEVEIKLRVADRAAIEARIRESGARLLHQRELEDNTLYDFPDRGLMRRGAMLRIRVLDRQTVLTYKDRARTEMGAKVREEVESTLAPSEADSLAAILLRIGLSPVFRYQKYRTTWETEGLHVTLDETPIGDFIELEGDKVLIDRTAVRLGYAADDYITASYRDLYVESPEGRSGTPDRMIFPT